MNKIDASTHWEQVYQNKPSKETSWYQEVPVHSLSIIDSLGLSSEHRVIDVGGGEMFLVDHLLARSFQNICVLDISSKAIEKTKTRLGEQSAAIDWVITDVATMKLTKHYDLWHDRACFHFLTEEKDIRHYVKTASKHINPNGHLIIGTFSENGPLKCSGLPVMRYNKSTLAECFSDSFEMKSSFEVAHQTPFGSTQAFIFGLFNRRH